MSASTSRLPLLTNPVLLFAMACIALSLLGMRADLARFITPEKGLGYALGITGGSSMILLLIYPARKRLRWLAPIGSVKVWFQIHMVLGILGPMLILFHSNFQTGATNSNVALVCMLLVAGSGLIGRYFYSRIHVEFHGSQTSLAELRGQITRLQQVSSALAFVPDLGERLGTAEGRMLRGLEGRPSLVRLPVVAARAWLARRQLAAHIRRAAHSAGTLHGMVPARMPRDQKVALELSRRHIDAVRRVAELQTYERLFSLWHVLHLPLFFMLLVAGVVHVVAVHIY